MAGKGYSSFVEDINRLQVIKCVVVGDKSVGKSHLVCAKASGTKYSLRDLIQMHISTVWAVDHYRTNTDVQRRSICTVECVTCSLRLWDTFGNHDKDRQFAYSSADVVLACFSVANRRTLRHIETHWMPEIFRFCGHLPVILCACQIDMRYLYNDPTYLALAREASHQKLSAEDIVLPDEGKAMAKKLGLYYYESSVLVQYGIDEVFSNCARAALISKRRGKILVGLGNLKSVVRPHLQVPHMPPRPPPPKVVPYANKGLSNNSDAMMLGNPQFSDVVFVVGRQEIEAHSVFLIAANQTFRSFLDETLSVDVTSFKSALRLSSNGSLSGSEVTLKADSVSQVDFCLQNLRLSGLHVSSEDVDENSEHDTGIGDGESRRGGSSRCLSQSSDKVSVLRQTKQSLRHRSMSARQYHMKDLMTSQFGGSSSIVSERLADSGIMGVLSEQDSGFLSHTPTVSSSCLSSVLSCHSAERGKSMGKIMIAVDERVSPGQFKTVLQYLYSGELPDDMSRDALMDLKQVARLMALDDLDKQIENVLNDEPFLNIELMKKHQQDKVGRLRTLFLGQRYFSDVTIELDDGTLPGHLALLAAKNELLLTMFSSEFSERSTGRVSFPGVSQDAFFGVMEYLYTGQCPSSCKDWIGLIELTDRFFLNDLLLSAEVVIIKELAASMEAGVDVVEFTLALLDPAKLHGAKQLVDYCTWLLKVNYKDLIENNTSALESLDQDLQAELARDRWPPLWYLKEVEIYEKAMLEMNKLRPQQSWLRRSDGEACISPGGCLSFWKRKK